MKWKTIETAPKDNRRKVNYIIITQNGILPDLVIWKERTAEKIINGNRVLSRPEGWFSSNGGRSRVATPTHWIALPEFRP